MKRKWQSAQMSIPHFRFILLYISSLLICSCILAALENWRLFIFESFVKDDTGALNYPIIQCCCRENNNARKKCCKLSTALVIAFLIHVHLKKP